MKTVRLHDLAFEQFISTQEIDDAIIRLAQEIDASYRDLNPVLLVVLNGAFVFAADLVRKISIPIRLDFLRVASYDGIASSGRMEEHFLWKMDLTGQHVIIIEDIVDTGNTLEFLFNKISKEKIASVKIACLLEKPEASKFKAEIQFSGFVIPDVFVVGYGLDYNGLGRDLDCIYKRKEE